MKNFLYIFLFSLLAFSCGKKGEVSSAKFKIFSGNLTDPNVAFPGGVLVMGRNIDGSQAFIVHFKPGLEMELTKGSWEFATIGWLGPGPIEGNQQCSFQSTEINSDIFTVNFNMNFSSCLNRTAFEGKHFTSPIYYDYIGQTFNGFKKLDVKTCTPLNSCSPIGPVSYKVTIQTLLKGLTTNVNVGNGLESFCYSTVSSAIRPPHGGPNGFIGLKITLFTGAGCIGTPTDYFFNHGFGDKIPKGVLSPNPLSPNPSAMGLAPLFYLGDYANNSNAPAAPNVGDLYRYTGGTAAFSPTPSTTDYIYYNGTWTKYTDLPNVLLFLEL
ncbi:MAG: hypothetical protein Q7U04_15725 [Bacteriovorax sp.]|nr:hypothetical protein [Bacteriovorax sp.]